MSHNLKREESAILELVSQDQCRPLSAEKTKELLGPPLDWGLFLDIACRQYVLPLVARNIMASGVIGGVGALGIVPPSHEILLEHAYAANRRRNDTLRAELEVIATAMERNGITVLLRKGLALTTDLYRDHGARVMSDIDFLVRRREGRRAIQALEELGYATGVPDEHGRSVVPWSPQGTKMMLMTVPNLPPMVRLMGIPECTSVNVGLTTGFFERNAGYLIDTEEFYSRSRRIVIGSVEMATTDDADTLIDLCAHFFKDAKSHFAIEYGKDLTLLKAVDIRLALQRVLQHCEVSEFSERVEKAKVEAPIWFTLTFIDAIFPGSIPSDLLTRWEPGDKMFIHTYGDNERQPAIWEDTDLVSRLFDRNRSSRKTGKSQFWGLTERTT